MWFLRQSVNLSALYQLRSLLLRPALLVPNFSIQSLNELNFDSLREQGIRAVVFDKDNTLTLTYKEELHPLVKPAVSKAMRTFPDLVSILSNSVGSSDDKGFKGAHKTEVALGIPVICHTVKKPGCIDELLHHYRVRGTTLLPHQICVVGDRILTDVVFANLHGLLSIHVAPLSYLHDHPVSTAIRLIENLLLAITRGLLHVAKFVHFAAGRAQRRHI